MENVQTADPYEAVLADLRQKREQIDNAISVLEALCMASASTTTFIRGIAGAAEEKQEGNRPDMGPGAFLGMTIHDAAKKLLATRRRQMPTFEIVQELERGGLVLTSADKLNTVGSVLLRRFNTVGDIVRVARGIWGLQEWYPGRKFAGSKTKAADATKGAEDEQNEAAVGNEEDTSSDKPVVPAGWENFPAVMPGTRHG